METARQVLWRLVAERGRPGADREAVEAEIRARFEQRRAVVFTDLVGFSRRTDEFGIVHFLSLIHRKRELLAPVVEQRGGRIVKQEADSWLLLFETPGIAVTAMLECQRRCAEHNLGLAGPERLELCVGIGWGELLVIGEHDVWGREVNVASRLGEDAARGGEILVSESVHLALAGESRRIALQRHSIPEFPGPCWRVVG